MSVTGAVAAVVALLLGACVGIFLAARKQKRIAGRWPEVIKEVNRKG